ncbi:MAG: BatD family protein [Thermodesulfobacteriota bacterium]|nr:BatD family protein [Thermodesulfobacteriota bacterium]
MKKSLFILSALLLFNLTPCPVSATLSVTLKLDRQEATLVDSIRLTVSVSGSRETNMRPVIDGLKSFRVTPGGTSSRFEIINGQMKAGIDYSYLLQPKETGKFEIGPARLTFEGKTSVSNTETLTIVEPIKSSGADRGPIFLNATIGATDVYVEEQAAYTLRLYFRVRIGDVSLNLPDTEGLTFKKLGKEVQYQGIHNGQSYHILEVRYAIIPSREGEFVIRPAQMNLTVFQAGRRSPWSPFDDPFFSSSGVARTLASEPVELKVLQLPREGRPADFSGMVGTFELDSTLAPAEIKTGESATLTVHLRGRGNVNRMPDLKIPELGQIKVYSDQPVLKVTEDEKGMTGSKTMKWALVPEAEGQYEIPRLSISFFDTKKRRYRTIKTRTLSLSVLKGEEKTVQTASSNPAGQTPIAPVKLAVEELGHDILPVHDSIKDLGAGSIVMTGGVFFWTILIAPFFAYFSTFLGLKLGKRSNDSMAALRARKASRNLTRCCRQKDLSSADLASAITVYFNDRFGLFLGALTPKEAFDILRSRGINKKKAQEFQQVVQEIEDAVYTGRGNEQCSTARGIPRLIKLIEKEIR